MEKLARQGRVHQEAKFIGTSGGLYWKKNGGYTKSAYEKNGEQKSIFVV